MERGTISAQEKEEYTMKNKKEENIFSIITVVFT